MTDSQPQRLSFEPVDTIRYELEAFADAIEGRTPFPITGEQMVATVATLEATLESIATGQAVALDLGIKQPVPHAR